MSTFSKGLVIWTKGTGDKSVSITTDSYTNAFQFFDSNGIIVSGSSSAPIIHSVKFSSTDETEAYVDNPNITLAGGSGFETVEFGDNEALMIVPSGTDDLTIKTASTTSEQKFFGAQSLTFGNTSSSIVIKNGGLLVLGGCDATLSSNGLKTDPQDGSKNIIDTACKYNTSAGVSNSSGGTGSITIDADKTLTIESGSTLHIGSYRYGNGTLTLNANLTLSGTTGKTTALNIGAANKSDVTSAVTVNNTSVITNSIVNVGGGCGGNDKGAGGAGGIGTLMISSDITDSNIFIGSGGGGAGGGSGGAGGGAGGDGNLTVSSNIENSCVFVGAAGGGGGGYHEAINGGAGGTGRLSVASNIENSYVFVGSGGAGGGGGCGGAGGGGSGGGSGSGFGGAGGGSGTLNVSDEADQISHKIVSFGLPAASGSDINQNIKTGAISDSIVFVGCGNYGKDGLNWSGGAGGGNGADDGSDGGGGGGAGGIHSGSHGGNGASIALDGENHGYLSQRMIMSFRGMTPGVLELPDSTKFPYIGEFPRADCTSWATTQETEVNLDDFIPPITDNRATQTYNSPPCFLEPVTGFTSSNPSFNAIIINPKKSTTDTSFGNKATDCVRISETSVDVIDKNINNGTTDNIVQGCFIGMFDTNNTDHSKHYYSTIDLTGFKVDASIDPSATPIKINTAKSSIIDFKGDCSISSTGTLITETSGQTLSFDNCEISGPFDVSGTKNLSATNCKIDSGTTVENNQPTKLIGTQSEKMDMTKLNMLDLNHNITLTDCSIGSGTTISGATGTDNGFVEMSGVTLADDKMITFNQVTGKDDTNYNKLLITGSTINADVTVSDINTSGASLQVTETIDNCIFNAPSTISGNTYTINSLEFNKGSFRNHSSAIAFENNVNVTVSGKSIELSGVKINAGATVNTNSDFGISSSASEASVICPIIEGTYDINLKNQLTTSHGIDWTGISVGDEPTLSINNSSSKLSKFKADKNCLLTFSADASGIDVKEGIKFDFNNANINNITIENDNGMTKTTAVDDTSFNLTQDNILISSLEYITGSSLTYDKTTSLITAAMTLYDEDEEGDPKPLQVTIANDSITNASTDGVLRIYESFQIGNTQVACSTENPLAIAPGKTVQFIGTGIYTAPTSKIETNTTILDSSESVVSGEYVKLEVGADSSRIFQGYSLNIAEKSLVLDGPLIINHDTYLSIDSDITIPKDSSLTLSSTDADNYVKFVGSASFVGTNNITFNISSGTTEESPQTITFSNTANTTSNDLEIGTKSTFIESTATFDAFDNTGECEFNNASGKFSFTNSSLFKMVHSKVSDDKTLKITNSGIVGWYNAEINPVDNGQMTIINCSSICPSISSLDGSLTKNVLTFNGALELGTLNIAPKGSLTILGDSAMVNTFKGTLQINNEVYLDGSKDADGNAYSPLSSDNAATTLILNTSKYDSGNHFKGQLVMSAQTGCSATLQINSSGRISINPKSKFIVSGHKENQKVIINGTFKSTVEAATYEYQKDMTLNGIIEMEHSAIIRGNLQITSSGKLLLGSIAMTEGVITSSDVSGITSGVVYDSVNETEIGKKYTITFNDGVNYAKTIITNITDGDNIGTTASYEGTGISPLRTVRKDDASDPGNMTFEYEYSNGLQATLSVPDGSSPSIAFSAPTGMAIGNVFFGDSSDVYISDALNIFGTFYNNGKLTVNARLTCTAGSSIFNDGEIAVKGGNDNTIIGTVEIGNLGHLIFNGTYRDHRAHRLVINERGTLTVNDSLTISIDTKEMIISALTDPQKCNVLINGDIGTTAAKYHFSPESGDKRESVYISINIPSDLNDYIVDGSA